jgi:hypothetical protein
VEKCCTTRESELKSSVLNGSRIQFPENDKAQAGMKKLYQNTFACILDLSRDLRGQPIQS